MWLMYTSYMNEDIKSYHDQLSGVQREICDKLYEIIRTELADAECKVWHGAPVWFDNGNPLVGYWARKTNVQLLFWSGQSFDEPMLKAEGTFKAAEIHYADTSQINENELKHWLQKARDIQWDYKNIVKRKGVLERLK